MEAVVESNESTSSPKEVLPAGEPEQVAILSELENVLNSQAFKASKRSQQFLSYVVKQTVARNKDLLKERNLGVELFKRPATYATGEDGVVRVQAGDVRRRLGQYYQELEGSTRVRIQLPVGSYVPQFHWVRDEAPAKSGATRQSEASQQSEAPQQAQTRSRRRFSLMAMVATGLGVALILVLVLARVRSGSALDSPLGQFWSPVLATSQPVLICVPKPVVYLPSRSLYQRSEKTHPHEFDTLEDRFNNPVLLDPKETIPWGDMVEAREFGIDRGDAVVAAQLAALFAHLNKPSQVRIGDEYSFADLRTSPAVLIGAFDNRLTLQMTSALHFVFAEENGGLRIEDRSSPGKGWSLNPGPQGQIEEDFGLISRLLDSKTGQVLFAAAGIGKAGTQAAGESITTGQLLHECLRNAPSDWQKKSMQVVVQSTVIDTVAGPPHVVATYFW